MPEKKYTKKELTEMAKQHGYFKRPGVEFVWGRENGHFYYGTPPIFTDGLESFKIKREEIEPVVKKPVTKKNKPSPKGEKK